MSSFMTRWSVLHEHEVEAADREDGGAIRDAAVARWVDAACSAYLDQCPSLPARAPRGSTRLREKVVQLPAGATLGRPAAVVVSASATEVLPTAFVLAVRVRPVGGDDGAAGNARCVVCIEDGSGTALPIGAAVRDELIALEHAARHFN
jgi:hypothetical protein